MSQEKQERIKACLQELATLLYSEADKSQLIDLEGIEKAGLNPHSKNTKL